MNCLNCGAPLELAAGRMVLTCAYCQSSQRLIDPMDDGDRVISLERPSGLNCPCCEQQLIEAALDGQPACTCPACQGILIAGPVFAEVVRKRRASFRGRELQAVPIDEAAFRRKLGCPVCQQPMSVHHHAGGGRAIIDSCDQCHLVWLDHAEMSSIERTPGTRSVC